jgi:hypothetical protein
MSAAAAAGSPIAAEYAVQVRLLPRSTAHRVYRMLGEYLVRTAPGVRRYERLGLLIELMQANDLRVDSPDYHAERTRRFALGEDWPSLSTLCDSYGGFDQAYRAALRLILDGTGARIPSDYRHAKFRGPCTYQHIGDAFVACRRFLGQWADEQTYYEWAATRRFVERRQTGREPNLPGRKQIVDLRGSYQRALAKVMEAHPELG